MLSNSNANQREFVYTEKSDNGISYTIRNSTYKLIKNSDGSEELYNIITDAYETNNLIGTILSNDASANKLALEMEADIIRM